MEAREAACAKALVETGATLVPPYGEHTLYLRGDCSLQWPLACNLIPSRLLFMDSYSMNQRQCGWFPPILQSQIMAP